MAVVVQNILRLLALILFQGLILNSIGLWNGQVQPMLYVLGILMLPIEAPVWVVLIACFFTGASVDLFLDTLGMHTSACLVLGILRARILALFAPRDGYEIGIRPRIDALGLQWFVSYAGILILVHHLWLFFLEVFRFSSFFHTFARALGSAIFTLMLCVLVQYLFFFKRRL